MAAHPGRPPGPPAADRSRQVRTTFGTVQRNVSRRIRTQPVVHRPVPLEEVKARRQAADAVDEQPRWMCGGHGRASHGGTPGAAAGGRASRRTSRRRRRLAVEGQAAPLPDQGGRGHAACRGGGRQAASGEPVGRRGVRPSGFQVAPPRPRRSRASRRAPGSAGSPDRPTCRPGPARPRRGLSTRPGRPA